MIISWLNKSHTETTRMFVWGLCWTAVFSFLANGFSYLNLMPQHDAVNHTIHFAGTWEVALGRWLLPFYGQIKGAIAVPLLTGILSIFFLGILVSVVCDVAGLIKNYQMILVAGFLSANASILELNSTFQYVVDAFVLSAALGGLGVWVLIKDKRPIRGMLIAILCLLLSLGIYQGEVVVFALMGVLFLIRGAIENRAIKKQFIYIGKLVGVAIASGLLYFVIFKVSCKICQVTPPNTYNSISGLISLSATEIVECACTDIAELLRFFFGSGCFVGLACRIANILLGILALFGIIVFLINRSVNVINKVIGVMSILISPILMILMSILMNQSGIRFYVDFGIFMAYPVFLLMISCISVTNDAIRKGVAVVTGVGGLIVLWSNIVYSNSAYSIQKLTFDRTQVMVSQIMMDLNKIEGYIPGKTPVYVLGSLDENNAISSISDDYRQFSAFNKVSTTYTLTLENFVNLMGQKIKIVEDATLEEEFRENRQTVSMPAFPSDGYVAKMDDAVVLKLSGLGDHESEDIRILIAGDSIGAGAGTDVSEERWFNILKKHLEEETGKNVIIDNPSLGGNTSYASYCMVKCADLAADYDFIFVCMGANPEAQFDLYYEEVLRSAITRYPHADVISIIENLQDNTSEVPKMISDLSQQYGIAVMDMYSAFNESGYPYEKLSDDGTHPNWRGHKLYGEKAIEVVDSLRKNRKGNDSVPTEWGDFTYISLGEMNRLEDLRYSLDIPKGRYLVGIHLDLIEGANSVQILDGEQVLCSREWQRDERGGEFYQVMGEISASDSTEISFSSSETRDAVKGIIFTELKEMEE